MSIVNGIKEKLKPVSNIVRIQTNAAQEVLTEQVNFMRDCITVSSRHAEELRDSKDTAAIFRAPFDIGRDISSKWMNTAGRQWDILMKTGDELTSQFKSGADQAKDSAAKTAEEVKAAAAQAQSNAEPAAATKTDSPTRKS